MGNNITIHKENKPIYDIHFEDNFSVFSDLCRKLETMTHKICIVTDNMVSSYYLDEMVEITKSVCTNVQTFVFPAGERSKNLDTVNKLYKKLIDAKFDRGDFLIALGGGVVGDLTGFAAATFLRGISFIQVPTTSLSMVDSSIGGKTGVDVNFYKNMVGAFYQPRAVYINISTLKTLSELQYFSGFGEMIKHGCIKDEEYFDKIFFCRQSLNQRDMVVLPDIIQTSCKIKQKIVEADPYEKGERALLNFGHTIGHSIEHKMSNTLLHGECVSLGIVAASYISYKREMIDDIDFKKIIECHKALNLPVSLNNSTLDPEELYDITTNDKKMMSGQIRFILLKSLGNGYIDSTVTKEEIIEAIQYLLGEVTL